MLWFSADQIQSSSMQASSCWSLTPSSNTCTPSTATARCAGWPNHTFLGHCSLQRHGGSQLNLVQTASTAAALNACPSTFWLVALTSQQVHVEHTTTSSNVLSEWRQVPWSLSLGPLTTLSAGLGQAPRLGKGISYRASKKPEKPIDIWVRF